MLTWSGVCSISHQSGAFLYVHSITHEITARRPVEFHDPEEER
jgi:hypothetical protein